MQIPKDPRAKLTEELFDRYRNARSDWDTEARTDIDFFYGNHFTENEVDELELRNQASVPMDRVGPAVEKMKAMLTSRAPAFTVIPREDSDTKVAKLWRTVMSYIWEISDGNTHLKQAIHDHSTTGMGYLYAYIDTEADFGKGEVKFTCVDPFRVYVPSTSRDRWFNDADNIILSTILTGEQVLSLYPELGPQINEETGEEESLIKFISPYLDDDFPTSQNSNQQKTWTPDETKNLESTYNERYQVLERFYKTKVPFYRVVNNSSGEEMIFDENEFQKFLQDNPGIFEKGLAEFEQVLQTRVGIVCSIGEVVLYESILNSDLYPIVPLPNIYTGTPYPRSDISRARPMQRLLNKLWSLALSHAQASAGLKLIVPIGSVDDVSQLEQDWANPNAVIEVDTSQGEPHFPSPTPLSGEFYRLIQSCEFYIDFTFGIPELMHGFSDKAPETVRGTERMLAQGSERPKSKLRDIEFSLRKLGQVVYGLSKGHYTFKKIFRLTQANNNVNEIMANYYDDYSETILDIAKERHFIGQHDISIEPGSTLPTSKWAEFSVYLDAYKMGLVDRVEVIKKNPELFDKEGLINRMSEINQLKSQVEQLMAQNKDLQGDLQTARRESVSDRKRIEVEKFKSRISGVESDKKANNKIQANKLENAVKLEVEKFGSAMTNAQEDLGSVQDIL
jgi:regulator of replication initiation timing